MRFIQKELFYDTLLQENRVLPYYNKLTNVLNSECLYTNTDQAPVIKRVISVSLYPSFLNYSLAVKKHVVFKKIVQKKITGYAVLLKEHKNLESLLRSDYKKSFRDNIKRLVNRLETCFDVRYDFHFGNIEKQHYDTLMLALKSMLVKRFDQRGDQTDVLKTWDHYLESTYSFILQKKASILAIYANEKLIHVCVNHHFKNILFVSVPSYDINYSKFALGNISIYKLLEWCLQNQYYMLDMAYGDLEYKRRWSNCLYGFEHHIFAPKNKPLYRGLASLNRGIIQIKNILKNYNIDGFIKKMKALKQKKVRYQNNNPFTAHDQNDINIDDAFKIDHFNINDDALQNAIFNFLYVTKTHIKNVQVFAHRNKKDFFILGKNISQKVSFKNIIDLTD